MDALPHIAKTDLGELHTKTSLGQVRGCARSRTPPLFGKAKLFHFDPSLGSASFGLVQI